LEAGAAAADPALEALSPNPVLVNLFDRVSKTVFLMASPFPSECNFSSSVFLKSALTPLSFNF